jgi:CheY-like chemotaxis protein
MQAFGEAVPEASRVANRHERESESLEDIRGANVLLVEDNEINQQVAKEILEGAGVVVTLADNGLEGVNTLKAGNYDAVLMDVQMPVMDGYTATREIRKDDRFKALPIIAITAHAMAGDEDKSLQAGINGHVTKPIDPVQLFATLQKWIKPVAERDSAPDSLAASGGLSPITDPPPETNQLEPDENELPDSLPGFDLIASLERLMGNKRLYRKLLIDFGADYGGVAGEIKEALAAGDFRGAHGLVHNLKGLAGNLAATELQSAAIEMEKLVKGNSNKLPSEKRLNQTYKDLDSAISKSLESVQTLGLKAQEKSSKLTDEAFSAIPAELIHDIADRLRNSAEMGDVMTLRAISGDLKSNSDTCEPLSDRIVQLAEDFDFDGILKLADKLDAI